MHKEKNYKQKVSLNTKFYSLILLIGLVLTGWALYNDENLKSKIFNDEMKWEEVPLIDDGGNTDMASIGENYLEGLLENSDDIGRGNLKLVSPVGQIYIRTARDFSTLIGFDVLVTIDGTLDKFTLLNIEKRVEKDGYIQAQ